MVPSSKVSRDTLGVAVEQADEENGKWAIAAGGKLGSTIQLELVDNPKYQNGPLFDQNASHPTLPRLQDGGQESELPPDRSHPR